MFPVIFEWLQVLVFLVFLVILIPLLGKFWSNLVQGNATFLHPCLEWLEQLCYRLSGINPNEKMIWTVYAKNLLIFNFFGFSLLFLILIFQFYLPLNPQKMEGLPISLAFNVAISFVTNTNWQSYAGETTLSHASQMLGLTVQNFLSAATGSAVLMAFIRGIARKAKDNIGNFWVDLVRSVVYLLLPLSFFFAIILVGEGVVQTLSGYKAIETLEKKEQIIPLGPVASQEAIKLIGTNGGGFYNANSAHPFENPTAWSNLLCINFFMSLPAALVYSYGLIIGSRKHAYLLLTVRGLFFLTSFFLALYSKYQGNPVLNVFPIWEGKELRFGEINSLLWGVATTATSTGAVNMMHESITPLAGGVLLFNVIMGDALFGGVGSGVCSLLMYVLLTVFLCGLMVGRTPEYRGKKMNKTDIQWIVAAICLPNVVILLSSGVASLVPSVLSNLSTLGPHGLTELLYAFGSTTTNNGSSFAGIQANTFGLNLIFGLLMLIGRLGIIIPSLAIAGSFAAKNAAPATVGTFSTDSFLFGLLLTGVIFTLGALAFLPALALGPVVEELLMLNGKIFPIEGA